MSRMYEALSATERKVVKTKIPYAIIKRELPSGDLPIEWNVAHSDPMVSSEPVDQRPARAEFAAEVEAAPKSPHNLRTYLTLGFAAVALVALGVGHALRAGHSGRGSGPQPYGAAFEGTIRPASEIRITAESLGTISKIYVKVGDTVRKGQPLLRMDDREARLALEHAALSRDAAENSLKKFRAPLADMNALSLIHI